ncbi:hypothetical protein V2J09_022553 [Rumex salicifolius]
MMWAMLQDLSPKGLYDLDYIDNKMKYDEIKKSILEEELEKRKVPTKGVVTMVDLLEEQDVDGKGLVGYGRSLIHFISLT